MLFLTPFPGFIRGNRLVGFAFLPAGLLFATSLAASTIVREPFNGITHIERTDWPNIPRAITANILLIDLDDPDIRFRLTEPEQAFSREESYTRAEPTLAYLERVEAQVAVNANFWDLDSPYPLLNPRFLAVSEGNRYSKIEGAEPALNIDANNNARIVTSGAAPPTYQTAPSVDLYNAAGGNDRIVFQGENKAGAGDGTGYYGPRARTVVGLTQDNKTLVIITVDEGRAASRGVTPPESGDLLIEYGVWDGINLDGGGSTTMAMADPSPRLVNIPNSGGTPRSVATSLAIFAAPKDTGGENVEFSNRRITRGVDEALISWETSEPAGAAIRYGEEITLDRESILRPEETTAHTVLLTDLDFAKSYNYRLVAIFPDGKEVVSPIHSFGPAGEVIVDDADPETTFTGSWNTTAGGLGWSGTYRWSSVTSQESVATFTPAFLIPGAYTVSTWYLASGNRATNTPYSVSHVDGAEETRIDQTVNGSEWLTLWEDLRFQPGGEHAATISNDASGGDVTIADAIRWKLTSPDPEPESVSPAWWNYHHFGEADPFSSDAERNEAFRHYLFGTDPTAGPPSFRLEMTPGDDGFTFDFFPAYSNRQYTVKSSDDLIIWTEVSGQELELEESGEGRITTPRSTAERQFYRLDVSRP